MAEIKTAYVKEFEEKAKVQLNALVEQLPADCYLYFNDIKLGSQIRTRLAYAFDLLSFYRYLSRCENFDKDVKEITANDLNTLTSTDISNYLNYMAEHPRSKDPEEDASKDSCNTSLARYLSSIKGYFKYLYLKGLLERNVTDLVKQPAIAKKEIVYLEPNEVVILLDCIENCAKSMEEGQQRKYQEKTTERDLALVSLFLGTGMRISELVGIDLEHVDFEEQTVYVYRKGGKEAHLYFNDEVKRALHNYVTGSRTLLSQKAAPDHENALFLSMQGKRMTVRAIEKMVEKYKKLAKIKKNITPHKLRSTYGTELKQQTGDIQLVATVLGHESIDTANKHYSALKKEDYRKAGNAVRFREQ